MASHKISILGCGWLGRAVAKRLVTLGYQVYGSTTTVEKIPILKSFGIIPFELHVDPYVHGVHLDTFFNVPTLLITLPFRRKLKDPRHYYDQLTNILNKCPVDTKIIFTSSTSVYPLENRTFSEEDPFTTDSIRSKALFEVEQLVRLHRPRSTILRLAGLYGQERPIGKFMASRKEVARPDAPVNLVHQDDVVTIICELLLRRLESLTLNVVSDEHPSRRELYVQKAKALGLNPPTFAEDDNAYKIISNQKIKALLGYTFQHPDPMAEVD